LKWKKKKKKKQTFLYNIEYKLMQFIISSMLKNTFYNSKKKINDKITHVLIIYDYFKK